MVWINGVWLCVSHAYNIGEYSHCLCYFPGRKIDNQVVPLSLGIGRLWNVIISGVNPPHINAAMGPSCWCGLTLIQYGSVITSIIKCKMKLHILSQTSTVQSLKLRNGWVIPSHTLLGMWLLIHAGIKVDPFKCLYTRSAMMLRDTCPVLLNVDHRKLIGNYKNCTNFEQKSWLVLWTILWHPPLPNSIPVHGTQKWRIYEPSAVFCNSRHFFTTSNLCSLASLFVF